MTRLSLLIFLGLATAAPAVAQNAPQPSSVGVPVTMSAPHAPTGTAADEWDSTEVTVTAHFPGPAIWRVKKGQSEVYILGSMPVMVWKYDWDKGRIGRVLDMSNVYLTDPKLNGGPLAFTTWQMSKGPGLFKTLYDVLPSDIGGRFWHMATVNHLDPQKYAHMTPVYAAEELREDIYQKHNITTADPEKMLVFLARDRKTPMRPTASYSALGVLNKVNGMSHDERDHCVAAMLNEIDFAVKHVQAATKAWATGDLAGAAANSPNSATLACLEGSNSTEGLLNKAVDDAVDAVDKALDKPGKSVVVFPLSVLLRKDGALDKLRAQGAEISEPEM